MAISALFYLAFPKSSFPAGIGDPVPSCSATDLQYSVTNVLPSGFCFYSGANITVSFDVNIWGPQAGYNTAIGYTAAGDPIIRDISCLNSNTDIDSVGCDDYDGSGTASNPVVAKATVNVSCGLPAPNQLAPVDMYLNYDLNSGGTDTEVAAPTCQLQTGISVPFRAARLRITAAVINDDGGTANPGNWTITANIGGGPVEYTGNGYYTGDGNVFAGDYELIGSGPAGYTLDEVRCTGATYDSATSAITVLPNNSADCVMIYNDVGETTLPEPLLTLNKSVVNDDGGVAVAEDFELSINGTIVAPGVATTVASGTNIIISEIDLPDYTEGVWSCFDNAGITTSLPGNGLATGTTLNLAAGSDVVCRIENNDNAVDSAVEVDLTITKSATDLSPSIGDIIRFDLHISNNGLNDATDVEAVDILLPGFSYVAGSIAGGNIRSDSDPAGIGLQWVISTLPAGSAVTLSYQATVVVP